jgi:hypothetical protein
MARRPKREEYVADTSPQPNVSRDILSDDVARKKLDLYEEITNKRTFCKTCMKYRKKIFKMCKDTQDTYFCRNEHGYEAFLRSVRKPKSEQQVICPFCGREFKNGKAMGAHSGSCKNNPKSKERSEKIRKAHIGLKHSDETKAKISKSMFKYHELKTREGIYTTRKVRVDNDKSLLIKIF